MCNMLWGNSDGEHKTYKPLKHLATLQLFIPKHLFFKQALEQNWPSPAQRAQWPIVHHETAHPESLLTSQRYRHHKPQEIAEAVEQDYK